MVLTSREVNQNYDEFLAQLLNQSNGQVAPQILPWQAAAYAPAGCSNYLPVKPSLSLSYQQKPVAQQPQQTFHFIDQTPANSLEESLRKKRRQGIEKPIDIDKSRVASQRRRDKRGQFIRNEIAHRFAELEEELKTREYECDSLRQTLNQRDVELEQLKTQVQQLMSQRAAMAAAAAAAANQGGQHPGLQTTSRNFLLSPSPNPSVPLQGRQPFMEKIDYTKIQLRKTDSSLEDEKREVINSQEQWQERLRLREFIRKLEEDSAWLPPETQPAYPPRPMSNIYPETLNKVGNLPVAAFTTKVDLSDKRQQLGKRQPSDRNLQKLLMQDLSQLTPEKARIMLPDLMKPYHAPVVWRDLSPIQIDDNEPNQPTQADYSLQDAWFESMELDSPFELDLDGILEDSAESGSHGQEDTSPRNQKPSWGGPPSNIYTPPEKIGNLQVPAFTTKINYAEVPLRKTTTSSVLSTSPPL